MDSDDSDSDDYTISEANAYVISTRAKAAAAAVDEAIAENKANAIDANDADKLAASRANYQAIITAAMAEKAVAFLAIMLKLAEKNTDRENDTAPDIPRTKYVLGVGLKRFCDYPYDKRIEAVRAYLVGCQVELTIKQLRFGLVHAVYAWDHFCGDVNWSFLLNNVVPLL